MKFIDTHSHLYHKNFQNDLDAVIERCRETCSHIFLPNIDLESIPQMLALTEKAPDLFFPMVGLHPCDVKPDFREVLKQMEVLFGERKYYGVGETGLDYYWDKTFVPEQKESLKVHIEWAKDMNLPLILHCRDSMDDVIGLIKEGQDGRLRGIFHCFTGTAEQAKQILSLGFKLGIGGVLTYKNSDLPLVLKNIPLEEIVLETDSPYLAPVPYRGKRNESSYVKIIGEKLGDVKEMDAAKIAEITSAAAHKLFSV